MPPQAALPQPSEAPRERPVYRGAMVVWLALGGLGLWAGLRLFAGYPAAPAGLRMLRRAEHATLVAVCDVLFPPGGGIAPSGSDADVPGYVDRFLATADPRQRGLIRLLLFAVEHGTLLFGRGIAGRRRLSNLEGAACEAYLESWSRSRLFFRRLVFTSLRALCCMGYFAAPSVLRELRLAPYAIDSPIVEADLLYPEIGASRGTVAWTRADLTPERAGPLALDGPLAPGYGEDPP